LLSQISDHTHETAAKLVSLSDNQPDHIRRLGLTPLLRLSPEKRHVIYRKEHARSAGKGEKALIEFASWLVSLGENERLLEYLPSDSIVKLQDNAPDLFVVRLGAYAGLDQWADVRRLLSDRNAKKLLGDAHYHLWLARVDAKEKRADALRQSLKLVAASMNPAHDASFIQEAANLAASIGEWKLAAEFCDSAAKHAANDVTRVIWLERSLAHHAAASDCDSMLAYAREIARLTPGNRA
jgi:hypothetical protein